MGKKSSKTKTTTEPPSWAKPILQNAGNTILNTVTGNQGNLNSLSSNLSGLLPQIQSAALNTSGLNSGQSYANNVLGGQYLNSNPYVENLAHQAEQDAGNAVNSTFSRAGRSSSYGNQEALAQGVAQAGNQVRFQNYQNERGLQNQAAGMLPSYQAARTAGIAPLLGAYQTAGQLPYAGIGNLGQIGSLFGGFGTSSGTQPGGWGNSLMNAGASIGSALILASDPRLKTNLVRVGDWDSRGDGLGKWRWNWRSNPSGQTFEGVRSDEVEKLRPAAFAKGFVNGVYDGVNYAMLGAA